MSQKERHNIADIFKNPVTVGSLEDFYNLQNRVLGFDNQPENSIDTAKKVFPQEKILWEGDITYGGKSIPQIKDFLKQNKINVGDYAKSMIENFNPDEIKIIETVNLVKVRIGDLVNNQSSTLKEIYQQAEIYNFYQIRPDVITTLDLYKDLKSDDATLIASKPIVDSGGRPSIFELERDGGGLWLYGAWTRPGSHWHLGLGLVFCLRK